MSLLLSALLNYFFILDDSLSYTEILSFIIYISFFLSRSIFIKYLYICLDVVPLTCSLHLESEGPLSCTGVWDGAAPAGSQPGNEWRAMHPPGSPQSTQWTGTAPEGEDTWSLKVTTFSNPSYLNRISLHYLHCKNGYWLLFKPMRNWSAREKPWWVEVNHGWTNNLHWDGLDPITRSRSRWESKQFYQCDKEMFLYFRGFYNFFCCFFTVTTQDQLLL